MDSSAIISKLRANKDLPIGTLKSIERSMESLK